MWGFIAFGLLILFGIVGYEVALKHQILNGSLATSDASVQLNASPKLAQAQAHHTASATSDLEASKASSHPASDPNHHQTSIEAARQRYDTGQATPEDLSIVSLSYFASNDCPNALTWANRSRDQSAVAGKEADPALNPVRSRCEPHPHHLRFRPDHIERATRLLNTFETRAEVDRQNLPQLEREAQQSKTGELDIKLGEIYFGFGDYLQAIAAIERGLAKGQIIHLDDAYVYLGRSQVAQGNIAAARNAFAKLKTVPNISPRVLRLWELYAETLQE
jgi:tetratricopeptide (TPR) repeat protein